MVGHATHVYYLIKGDTFCSDPSSFNLKINVQMRTRSVVIHTEAKNVCRVHFGSKLYKEYHMCKIWAISAAQWKSAYGVGKQWKLEGLLHSPSLWLRSRNSLTDIRVSHNWAWVCLNAVNIAGKSNLKLYKNSCVTQRRLIFVILK